MLKGFSADCSVTGIGSLPHLSPVEACDFVLRTAPEVVFWPQLPQRDEREGMIDQFTRGLPGMAEGSHVANLESAGFDAELEEFYTRVIEADLDKFALSPEEASGLYHLESLAERGALEGCKAVKGQITGPVTMSLQLYDSDKRFLVYSDTYREVIVRQLVLKGRWLEERLRRISPTGATLVFLDEPLLYTYGSAHYNFPRDHVVGMLVEVLGGLEGATGIHACSNCDWSLLFDAGPDVISFDAYQFAETFLIYGDRIADFVSRGGIIAWGIVPNTDELYHQETDESLLGRIEAILRALEGAGLSSEQVLRQSLITPACGVGSLDVAAAERVFELAGAVSDQLKSRISARA